MRKVSEPIIDEYGADTHPAFGVISASRVSSTPGSILFDSDIRHGHTVIVRINTATRKRQLKGDWIHPAKELIELEMSEAQWASFVSTMNTGSGVPCTIRRNGADLEVDRLPYAPRLAQSMTEVHEAAEEAFTEIRDALAAYETALADKVPAKERKRAFDTLRARISNATPNIDYAGKKLSEHAENVVQRARADIEAIIMHKVTQLGIDAGDVRRVISIEAGGDVEVVDESEQDDRNWGAGPAHTISKD